MAEASNKLPVYFRDLKGTRAMKAHNKNTAAVAPECVALGLPVVDVHSIDDNGECTCQDAGVYVYGKSEKRTALVDGRARRSYGHSKLGAVCGAVGAGKVVRWASNAT
jgi:hypothetical protein